MQLAGIRVPDSDVAVLAGLVDEPTRGVLEKAHIHIYRLAEARSPSTGWCATTSG